MQTTKKQWTTGALALMLAAGAVTMGARAQADDNGPPPPPPGAPGTPPDAPPPGGGNRGGARRTPEQMQVQRTQMLKRTLDGAGVTDPKTQDPIVAFAGERETAGRDLHKKMRAVATALHNGAATDQEIAASLANLRSAVAAEKTRRAAAEKALDAEVGFSKNPRLDALLTTMGLIGDEAAVAGPPPGMGGRGERGPGAPGGRNRRGGAPDNGPPPPDAGPDGA